MTTTNVGRYKSIQVPLSPQSEFLTLNCCLSSSALLLKFTICKQIIMSSANICDFLFLFVRLFFFLLHRLEFIDLFFTRSFNQLFPIFQYFRKGRFAYEHTLSSLQMKNHFKISFFGKKN